jgi:hypothetical protein
LFTQAELRSSVNQVNVSTGQGIIAPFELQLIAAQEIEKRRFGPYSL